MAYAGLGEIADQQEWLPVALAAATAWPLALLEPARRMLSRQKSTPDS
jgi:hypothetical protein